MSSPRLQAFRSTEQVALPLYNEVPMTPPYPVLGQRCSAFEQRLPRPSSTDGADVNVPKESLVTVSVISPLRGFQLKVAVELVEEGLIEMHQSVHA